ncbi:MAG TPA: ABC transporter ATP-binding protein [Bryobacteraceae bacterium]|nr:ABC transporter ATP-binding protein [Bryobacteraceae bacterium]
MISCHHLTRRFGDFTAVDNLTLEIPKGAICAFMGPNGAGKSTTVNMLTGLLAPTSGDAVVAGLSITDGGIELKRRIGVLPANLGLFDDLTIEEHLFLTGDIYGVPREEARRRTAQLLSVLDLEHGRDVFLSRCSSGMRKKTALAMALIYNPPVLFLDEPFEAVDPFTSRNISELLVRVASRGTTVFLTSHILSTIERMATQFVIIRGGRIAWNSTAAELTRPLEELYFDLIQYPPAEDLEWLGCARS